MKKILCIMLVLILCALLAGCGNSAGSNETATSMSFSDALSIDSIKALDGKTVSITGYMATLSPVSGKYIYLMNMPYQSCPFCVPNTTQLANTMAVYARDGKTFDFTDQAIRVTGVMDVDDFTDEFGYTYNYRIRDATYEVMDMSQVSDTYALWQTIAADGIVSEVNSMLDYVYFLCCWPDYTMSYTDENGNDVTYYLYPGDAQNYLADATYGYAKQSAEGYFESLISRVNAISADKLTDLTDIITAAKAVEQQALNDLNTGAYTYSQADDKYTLTNAEALYNSWYSVYYAFSQWMTRWQM